VRKGFALPLLLITLIVIIAIAGFVFYLLKINNKSPLNNTYNNISETPSINNPLTKKTSPEAKQIVDSIPRYSNSTNWSIKNNDKNCILAFDGCWGASIDINFESVDNRELINSFYTSELNKSGWIIDDSMGGSGVLPFKKQNSDCGIYINNILGDGASPIQGSYNIRVACGNDR